MIWITYNGFSGSASTAATAIVEANSKGEALAAATRIFSQKSEARIHGFCEITKIDELVLPVVVDIEI